MHFFKYGLKINFIDKRKFAFIFSFVLILISIISLIIHIAYPTVHQIQNHRGPGCLERLVMRHITI